MAQPRARAAVGAESTEQTVRFKTRPEIARIALTLQGGGALGAYQAGVYEALEEERWSKGYRDARRACERAAWLDPIDPDVGVVVYELPPEPR